MKKIVIDPRVIKHLGRDLITSPEVAVIELVKNSIDAKAKHINLRLYNNYSHYESLPNYVRAAIPKQYLDLPMLIVEDDGRGMTNAALDDGFLKIATDIKTNEEGTLGEKGIGRLATQRLGTALLVETSSVEESQTSYVFIDWNDVINGVEEVPNFEGPATPHHTRLIIFNVNLEDYIANEVLNLCSFNSDGQCRISLSAPLGLDQEQLIPNYMTTYYSKLQHFFNSVKTLRIHAEDAFETVIAEEYSPRLLSFKDFDKTSETVSFDLRRVCRLTHDYVFYLYKLYLEYRGRKPFQTINLIRQEDTSLPVLFNKKETGEYLSFRSVPIPGKNNRKDWCWIIDVSELNRILESLGLPILLKTDQEVILKNDNAELNLELGKKVQIVKARKKVYLETY